MTTLAVTGHIDLDERTAGLVARALRALLSGYGAGELVGVSCIAAGADSLFAREVIEAGGRLVAVIPSRDYRQTQVGAAHAATFDLLAGAAEEVVLMPFETAGRRAYEAANGELLRRADRLVAVWDGQPPGGKGGTADAVVAARAVGMPVDVVWPEGSVRGGAGGSTGGV